LIPPETFTGGEAAGHGEMSPLRKLTTAPCRYLLIVPVFAGLVLIDSARKPQDQVTAKLLVSSIRLYQRACAPLVSHFVCCRYRPTCSQYSIQAIRRHGAGKGLLLSFKRVLSCTKKVPHGTPDPVPQCDQPITGDPSRL
jgi:putative membrane protein insertion efficiency factor